MLSQLAGIRIVLVEPAGPLNVGSVARVMKNFGLQQLVLVNPQCDPFGPEARQMAVHGGDCLAAAQQVMTIPEALAGCQRAIATTARDRTPSITAELPRSALPWLLEGTTALIFGPEDRGLSNEELNYAQRLITIPTSAAYSSLNLAQAVAVCCYELYQLVLMTATESSSTATASTFPNSTGFAAPSGASDELAPLDTLEAFYQQLEAVLLQIGYLYPHTADSRMAKFRRLFHRSQLSPTEVAMLRGILSQIVWYRNSAASEEMTDNIQ